MEYDSVMSVESELRPGVRFRVYRMSFGRRLELMRRVREMWRRVDFLEAGSDAGGQMDARLLRAEINRLFLQWGLVGVEGLTVDGAAVTADELIERGPEDLCLEALAVVHFETGLNEEQRKN